MNIEEFLLILICILVVVSIMFVPSAIAVYLVNKKPQFMFDVTLNMDMKSVAKIIFQVSARYNSDCSLNKTYERSQCSIHLIVKRNLWSYPYAGAIRIDIDAQDKNHSVVHFWCPMKLIGYTFYKRFIDSFLIRVDVLTGLTGDYTKGIKRLW